MSLRTLVPAALLLATAFSGCFAAEDEAGPASASDAPSGSVSAAPTTAAPNATANVTLDPPVAAFTVAPADANETNLTAGFELLFNASASTDPAGGNLTFAWDLGDGNATEGVVANHTYATAGNYTIFLTVISDASGLNATANQTLAVLEGGPKTREAVTITDPSGDGSSNYGDVQKVTISDDGTTLLWKFTVGAVQPGAATEAVICFNLFVKGAGKTTENRYEPYSNNGAWFVYDYTGGGDMAGGKVAIVGTGYEVRMPLETMTETKSVDFPLTMRVESRGGECWNVGGNGNAIFDKAPNAGGFTYG